MNGMVIIGAGECGTRAAFALREQGYDGPVTLIGAEAGLPYERPPLSKPDGGQAIRKPICDQAVLDAAGIDYRPGMSVEAIDRQTRTLTLTGGRLAYDRLLIATGARPRRLTCPGAKLALDFRTHADASAVLVAATGPVASTAEASAWVRKSSASLAPGQLRRRGRAPVAISSRS